ncbi:MAG: PhoPQ-activated protein PqaA family protein [Cellvibrionales bacterium]|nr:PhoPQ-activated protein PqaA family protein [Cellvibrionales bacterium]
MKKILAFWLTTLSLFCASSHASSSESNLAQFYQEPNNVGQLDLIESTQLIPTIKYHKMSFASLHWPTEQSIWRHRVNLHVPQVLTNPQGVIFIHGGTNYYPNGTKKGDIYDNDQIPFALSLFALQHGVMVIEIKDIPNQYLSLTSNEYLKEDAILARSMKKALKNDNPFLAVQLPMAKSISLCLDALQAQEENLQLTLPKKFLITGLSKRSWASWLALIEDKRINAIIPGVFNLLDQENTLSHNNKSLGYWPEAFYPFLREGIAEQIRTEPYHKLMESIDPWQYFYKPAYRERFSVPKLILTASNDEFLTPDSQNQIIDQLQGPTFFRVVPNSSHSLNVKAYIQTVSSFLAYLNGKCDLARITWELEGTRLVSATTSKEPKAVNYWIANNPKWRDFRKTTGIEYTKITLAPSYSQGKWTVKTPKTPQNEGYFAHFIEFIFSQAILTTPAFVTPDTYPEKTREFELSPAFQKHIKHHFYAINPDQ